MFFLAIQRDPHRQLVAVVRREKKEMQIIHLRALSPDVKPLDILGAVLEGKSYDLVTGLTSSDVFLRTLFLQLKSRREILSALPFQVENLLPYPEEEVILLPTLFPPKEEGTEIFLLATEKKVVEKHLENLKDVAIDPDVVSCTPLALFRFARHYFPAIQDLCVYHLGENQSLFIVIKEGKLQSAHTQNFGHKDLVDEKAHFSGELERMVAYLNKKNPHIEHILLTGSPMQLPHMESFSILDLDNPSLKEYALPIGLALDAAHQDPQSGQFRLKEEVAKRALKKNKHLLRQYFGICLCGLALLCAMGTWHLKKKEKIILTAIEAPEGMRLTEAIDAMKEDLYPQKKSALASITTPPLTTVLSWLSAEPALSKNCSITHLRYQLVKVPKLGSSVKSSIGKVEFEMHTENAKSARAFHEELLKDTQMIDQNQKIGWKIDRGVYHVSFFLKKRAIL